MPDLIVNGSFETADWWIPSGNADRRNDLGAQDGAWAARLFVTSVFIPPPPVLTFGSWATPSFALVPGEVYAPTFYADGTYAGGPLACLVDCGTGTFEPLQSVAVNEAIGWARFGRSFTALGTAGRIRFENAPQNSGSWLLDLVSVPIPGGALSVARHSKHLAFNAVIALLKTLRGGATYHTDLGDRVYPVLVTPEEGESLTLPYACFPLIDEFTFEESEHGAQLQWTGQVHLFVPETASDAMRSTASETAAKAEDDLTELFLSNPKLSRTVQSVTLLGGNTEAGVLSGGVNYGEVIFRLQFHQEVSPEVLGP